VPAGLRSYHECAFPPGERVLYQGELKVYTAEAPQSVGRSQGFDLEERETGLEPATLSLEG
jgi:hypothetical protein